MCVCVCVCVCVCLFDVSIRERDEFMFLGGFDELSNLHCRIDGDLMLLHVQ